VTSTSVTLTWGASTDNVGVTGYEVFKDGVTYATPSGVSQSITGLAASTTYSMTVRARDAAGNWSAESTALNVTTAGGISPIRIEAGATAAFTDTSGNVWAADNGYVGGSIVDRGAIAIANTSDDKIYQTERWGVTGYAFAVANGTYTVKLHFAETYTGITAAGQRVFSVTAEGVAPTGWTDIDVYGEAGGRNIALVKSASVVVTDGTLNLNFASSVENTMIDGIEILPAAPPDTTAPSVPSGLVASNIMGGSFTLSWSASTDNVGVTRYEVFKDGVSYTTPAEPTVNVSDLAGNTTYSMTVRARDAAGNWSAQSSALNVTTITAESIGVNLTDTNNSLAATDVAGAVPAAHWNNSTVNNQSLSNVVDSTGAATTTHVSFGTTPWSYNNSTTGTNGDAKMMRSYRAGSNTTSIVSTSSQIPYALYDVYVYWGGRRTGDTVPVTMAVDFQLWNGSAWVSNQIKYIKDGNHEWDGTYDESTATTAGAAVDGNEYVVFRNVTATTFKVVVTTAVRVGFCGFQIVKR
jgi:chitodextrinase